MNDSAIINIISSIYSKAVIFFASIFILFSILFFTLLHGIVIHELHLPSVKIKELYIKWDEKFIISIEDARIFTDKTYKRNKPFDLQTTLAYTTDLYDYFKKIDIKHLYYKDITASIKYAQNTDGFVKIESKFILLDGSIYIDKNNIYLQVAKLRYYPFNISAKGYILFDKSNKSIETDLDTSMLNEAFFTLHTELKSNTLHFKTSFKKKVEHPKRILNVLSLPNSIRYWAIDAYTTSGVDVKEFQGEINIKEPQKSIVNIYARGTAHNVCYKYNKKIEPVCTSTVELEFKHGILSIRPKNATSYGFNLQRSYLTIDLTKMKEMLTLYLRFDHGKLDKNILHILKTYHIDVPLIQTSGDTKTNLTLKIHLRDIRVEAKGDFYVKHGSFYYLQHNIDVNDLHLKLDGIHLWANKMKASIAQRVASLVDMDLFLGKEAHGKIDFYIEKVQFDRFNLQLKSKNAHIVYYINHKTQDTIEVPRTLWMIERIPIEVEGGKFAFNTKRQVLMLPIVKIGIAKNLISLLSGNIDFAKARADLDLDITKMAYNNVKLAQSDLHMHLLYKNETLHFSTNKQTRIYVSDKEATLDKFDAVVQNGELKAKQLILCMKNLFQSSFDLDLNLHKKRGKLTFKYLKFYMDNFPTVFESTKPLVFKVRIRNGLKLASKKLAAILTLSLERKSSFELLSFKRLLPYSDLLRRYKIKSGTFKLEDAHNDKFAIKTLFTSDYALLVKNEMPLHQYKLVGFIGSKNIFTLNKDIRIILNEKIDIEAQYIGLNIAQIENFIESMSQNIQQPQKPLRFYTHIDNGYLYISKERRVLFDSFDLQSVGNETTIQLKHKQGAAGFRYKAKKFYLYGSGFGDEFMDNLFFLSKFKGGSLDFSIVGSFDDYRGIIELTDTTILDYKILNNILAFIDTVPSLVTFSLPSYSKEGLKVTKAYASFHYNNDTFDFDNIRLDSQQLQIVGKGKASYKKDFIDLLLQLKTTLADKASKIPVVGYILFDGKNISTTLKVTGKLEDPKVTTMIAKEIAVAPLNIIKRTLLLPAHLLGLDKKRSAAK